MIKWYTQPVEPLEGWYWGGNEYVHRTSKWRVLPNQWTGEWAVVRAAISWRGPIDLAFRRGFPDPTTAMVAASIELANS